jgi:SAM-dependent methyltransferase
MSDDRIIDSPPEGAEGWRRVWLESRTYPSRLGPAFLFHPLRKLVGLFTRAERATQRDFNLVVLDLIGDLRSALDTSRRDYLADLEQIRGELLRIDSLIPVVARRNDALIAALDQKIEALRARLNDLSLPLLENRSDIRRDDFVYRRMEEGVRGSSAAVAAAVEWYVERASGQTPILDLGCGRGEFLERCRERGLDARGIDSNERSIAELRSRGLDVELAEVPEALSGIEPESIGAIFAAHLVEHLPFSQLVTLFAESFRILRSGGLLMIETPNAESLVMSARDLWRDPTHLAPRHKAALVSIGRECGFLIDTAEAVHPWPESNLLEGKDASPEVQQLVERLNELLYAPQDLRLVLRKP